MAAPPDDVDMEAMFEAPRAKPSKKGPTSNSSSAASSSTPPASTPTSSSQPARPTANESKPFTSTLKGTDDKRGTKRPADTNGPRAAEPKKAAPSLEAAGEPSPEDLMAKMGIAGFGKKSNRPEPKKRGGGGGGGGFADALMLAMGNTKKTPVGEDPELHKRRALGSDALLTPEVMGRGAGGVQKSALPLTHVAALRGHDKAATAVALDRSGSRLITGGMDYQVKMWAFAGMTSSLQPFRTFEPHEGYPVNDLSYSPSGDRFVASITHRQPLIFDREGKELAEFVMGDVYVTQERLTRGHTAQTTSARWDPNDASWIITASLDGTCRLWNPEDVDKRQKVVFCPSAKSPGKHRPKCTFADFTANGKSVIAGCSDGQVTVWSRSKGFKTADMIINAHPPNTTITSIATSVDNHRVATRGSDGTVKLWDLRKVTGRKGQGLDHPVACVNGLDLLYDNTTVTFGHSDQYIATGTGANPKTGERGRLVVLNATNLATVADIPVAVGSVCSIHWSNVLSQVFVTCQDGACYTFYSPSVSTKGILLCLNKHKKMDETDYQLVDQVYTPTSDNMKEIFQQAQARRTSTKPFQKAPTERDFQPVQKGEKKNTMNEKAQFLQDFAPELVVPKFRRGEDPREALQRVAADAENDPQFAGSALKGQPKIFSEEEEVEEKKSISSSELRRRLFSSFQ